MIQLKNPQEIEKIRLSADIISRSFELLKQKIRVGVSTAYLNDLVHELIIKEKAVPAFLNYQDFPASICTAVNECVIHGIPSTKEILEDGDIIGVDIGVIKDGFYADAAYTFCVGEIDADAAQLLKVTKESLYLGIDKARPGKRIKDISRSIYTHVRKFRYDVVREFCGHGVGFDLHEEPSVFNYMGMGPNPRIKEGLVLAIEPMVNMGTSKIECLEDGWTIVTRDGSLSAHFEHTVAVGGEGPLILTRFPE